MKINVNTAVSTTGVLLVPYDERHVPTYHDWMEDEAIREATASDRLTLEEEYENQVSWRAAADKLTFIVCEPLADGADGADGDVVAGVADAPGRMVGDINFFLHPFEADEEAADARKTAAGTLCYSGEIDVMIAQGHHRGRGFGRAAVTALLHYILARHRAAILNEAAAAEPASETAQPCLSELLVKIQATNAASIGLFTSLSFRQRGAVNYFGEVTLVRSDLGDDAAPAPAGYAERTYMR